MHQQKNNYTQSQIQFVKIASKKQREWCQAIAINDDCSLLFIGFKSSIKVFGFDQEYLKQIVILNHHTNYITDLKICKSKQNQFLISASDDKTIIIWTQLGSSLQNPSWSCYQRLYGHENTINCLVVLENTEYIISGSSDCSIKFWSNSTQTSNKQWSCSQTIHNHTSEIWALSINQSEDTLISNGEDMIILVIEQNSQIWIVKQKIQVQELGYRVCFIGNNLFCFQPMRENLLHIYEKDKNQKFIQTKQIKVEGGEYYCKPYFQSTYINEKCLLIIKNGCKINIFRILSNDDEQIDTQFFLQQVIDFGTTDGWGQLYGSINENGEYLVTWDYKSEEIQIRQLKGINQL
ncbi:unnamed protein product [Paramecium pentaurelia]|uniref:WD40-repeat-containing domain n=1 Tax=Paramecium pentaurelia TaxID=43138 RepID=A0A8S1X947_9CILI|nr:unnamed protein product [Paramecium pentaurelia]